MWLLWDKPQSPSRKLSPKLLYWHWKFIWKFNLKTEGGKKRYSPSTTSHLPNYSLFQFSMFNNHDCLSQNSLEDSKSNVMGCYTTCPMYPLPNIDPMLWLHCCEDTSPGSFCIFKAECKRRFTLSSESVFISYFFPKHSIITTE